MNLQLVSVQLVSAIVLTVVALMLLLLFLQLPRFGAPRNLVAPWVVAWIAQTATVLGFSLESIRMLAGKPTGPVLGLLPYLHYPGRFVFLAMVVVGALQAAGRDISADVRNRTIALAAAGGLLIGATDASNLGTILQMFAMPVLLFGAAQLVMRAASGARERGLIALSIGLMIYASLRTVFLIVDYSPTTSAWMTSLGRYAYFGEAFVLAILGGTVVALVVQDSFLQAADAREARLRDISSSEIRLKRVIEAAGEAIVTFDIAGRINLANAAAERLFALPSGEVCEYRLTDLVEVTPAQLLTALEAARQESTREHTLTSVGRRGDGTSFPVEFTVGAMAQPELPGGVAILRDLTQRRAAEIERESFERRLAASEKMLAIGRVVSGVAHELNNPLAVVLGQSEHLVDTNDAGEVQAGLKLINEQAHRARHIVKDLLAFVRQRDDQVEAVDLAAKTKRVIAAQKGVAEAHNVTLRCVVPDSFPLVAAEGPGLEQVLVNLIENGMDAAAGGGTVSVTLRVQDGRAEIVVEDTGPGVPEHLVPRIFEPFFTTKPLGEGTGLGLPVALGVVERHGGTLKFENRPQIGIGARFTASLLILEKQPEVADQRLPAQARVVTIPAPRRRDDGTVAEVMLIDDEPSVRTTLARIFQRGGWQVREAGSGEAGLGWLMQVPGSEAPDVILCDLKMPGIGGAEVHAQLAAARPELLTRMIFVTGDVVEASTAAFLAMAGREVVEKPFTVAEIAQAVERVVTRDREQLPA